MKTVRLGTYEVLDPPQGAVVWVSSTAKPGEPGVAVLAGHNSADVFLELRQLQVGDPVSVGYNGRTPLNFQVLSKCSLPKEEAANDPDIWWSTASAGLPRSAVNYCDLRFPRLNKDSAYLWLLTCDPAPRLQQADGHSSHNIAVLARLVPP